MRYFSVLIFTLLSIPSLYADSFTVAPNSAVSFCSPNAASTGVSYSVSNLTEPAAAIMLLTQTQFQVLQNAMQNNIHQFNLTYYANYSCLGSTGMGVESCVEDAPSGTLSKEINCVAVLNKDSSNAINGTIQVAWNSTASASSAAGASYSHGIRSGFPLAVALGAFIMLI